MIVSHLHLLHYYVWGVVEKEVTNHLHHTKSSLMELIAQKMKEVSKNQMI